MDRLRRLGRGKLVLGGLAVAVIAPLIKKHLSASKPTASKTVELTDEEIAKRKERVAVDGVFFKRFKFLLKIVLPNMASKEFLILITHTMFLVLRTLATIYITKLDGYLSKSIVERNKRNFGFFLGMWLLSALPISYINSMIRYLESKLALAFRSRLVNHVYTLYMKDETYYRVSNLDSRLSNPDQCLTEDVSQWCTDLAHLYSQLSKPMLDVVLMTYSLATLSVSGEMGVPSSPGGSSTKFKSLTLGLSVVTLTGALLRYFTPPFGKLVAEQAKRYGELRAVHSRLITHSEEIAFYGGHAVEETVLRKAYRNLVSHMNVIYKKRIFYTMLEQFLMKYMWSACGLVMISLPAFVNETPLASSVKGASEAVGGRSGNLVTARGLLTNAADAIERIMSSWKEVTELAGRTARVTLLLDVFEDMRTQNYQKELEETVVDNDFDLSIVSEEDDDTLIVTAADGKTPGPDGEEALPDRSLKDMRWEGPRTGVVIDGKAYVELKNVPVVTPSGDILVNNPGLDLQVVPGQHLLITGPNGCGKSSLFRMLGGLWPVAAGVLVKPKQGDMFYIPQRPYLTNGNLLEQFVYPHTAQDFLNAGNTVADLDEILQIVDLKHVVTREGGWNAVKGWRDVLSGGEKQRVGFARVLYHKPKFAILDECTSAVSIDVEGQMYTHAKDIGISLLTVTHRPSLWKYHTHLLQFDGQGGYTYSELNADARLSFEEEKKQIENSLKDVPKLQERLQYLCNALGADSDLTAEALGRRRRNSSVTVKHAPLATSKTQ